MSPEQILATAQGLADTRTNNTRVLNEAADISATRRLFRTEEWLRRWANTRVNLAGSVPTEYQVAVGAAHLIVEGHHS